MTILWLRDFRSETDICVCRNLSHHWVIPVILQNGFVTVKFEVSFIKLRNGHECWRCFKYLSWAICLFQASACSFQRTATKHNGQRGGGCTWSGESKAGGDCGWIKPFILKAASSTPTFPPKQNSFIPPLQAASLSILCIPRSCAQGKACRTGSMLAPTAMALAASVGGEETSLSGVDVTGSQSTQTRKTTRTWIVFQLLSNTRAQLYLTTEPLGGEGLHIKDFATSLSWHYYFRACHPELGTCRFKDRQTDERTAREQTTAHLPD